jgi:hypothetical protein
MRKIVLTVVLLLSACMLKAQDYKLVADASIPAEAAQVLVQRFTQMLTAGGLSVSEEGADLIRLIPTITSKMEVSDSQVALTVDLKAVAGDISEVFPIKGVGENEADAWVRAAKLILPRSKAAQGFVEKLKSK